MASRTPHQELLEISMGLPRSRALAVAVELDLAGHLADGPLEVDVLAARTETHAPSLFRLLRALASIGVFEQVRPAVFGNSPPSALLRKGAPGSFWAANRMGVMIAFQAWAELANSIRTGRPSFHEVHAKSLWQFLAENPEAREVFDESMRSMTAPATPAVTLAYDWSKTPLIADIGGGVGTQLVSILDAHPACRGLLFDRPEVLRRAVPHDRVEHRAGDVFRSVPSGADAYLLRFVVHDWPEPEALMILSNVRAAMSRDSRLMLVELIMPETLGTNLAAWSDLGMMVLTGGRERTADEYRALLARADLELETIVPTKSPFSILVARPVDR